MVTTNAVRYPVSSVIAVCLMAGFFLALFTIISQRPAFLLAPQVGEIEFKPSIREREFVAPKLVKPDPIVLHPTPVIPGPTTEGPSIDIQVEVPAVKPGPLTGFQGRIDSSEQPLVRSDPVYPRNAIARGIEGWVELQFTISGSGAVTDVTVIDADPKGLFDAAASKAVQSWKYAPRVREGRAVEQRGVRVVLRFDLD